MQYAMNKFFLPYLYDNKSIPDAIMKFGIDANSRFDSVELADRASNLLTYNDYIMDKTMIHNLRDVGYELAKKIRANRNFKNIRFTINGRRKSLFSMDDKITECQARDSEISISDMLGIRIIIHNLEAEEHMDILTELAIFIIDFFRQSGFIPLTAQKMKDTDSFDASKHPEIIVPEKDILPLEYRSYAKDYIAHPKAKGYQTLQGVMADPSTRKVFEWQLRTMSMHMHAEILSANHSLYKENKIANRQTDGNEFLETEVIDYNKLHLYGFMASGVEDEPFIDMAGLLKPQMFLQCQRISSLVAEQ